MEGEATELTVEEIAAVEDPAARARLATEHLSQHQSAVTRLAKVRRAAIAELRSQGLSFRDVADELGISRGRIAQLQSGAHVIEQQFFGGSKVTIATPLRSRGKERPLVAQEDFEAATALGGLNGVDIQYELAHVSPAGEIDLSADALVAICGPKSSETINELIRSDPVLDFECVNHRWIIRDRSSGQEFHSKLDDKRRGNQDIAYVGRLSRDDGRSLLVIAGVHAVGSLGAVNYLADTARLSELHKKVGTNYFSMVIASDLNKDADEVTGYKALTQPEIH